MNAIRTIAVCMALVLFHSCGVIGGENDVVSVRRLFEKAHEDLFSIKVTYEYQVMNTDGKSVTNKYNKYHYYDSIVYVEFYDDGFHTLTSQCLYRDGSSRRIFYQQGENGLVPSHGMLSKNKVLGVSSDAGALSDIYSSEVFNDVYGRIIGLFLISDKGGMHSAVSSVTYNNEVCYLVEFTGSGKPPIMDGEFEGLDPRMLEPYYNTKNVHKVWISREHNQPIRFEFRGDLGKLTEAITYKYQTVNGYGTDEVYFIPREIVTEKYAYRTSELKTRIVARFGECEINGNYPLDAYSIDFPPGLSVDDADTGRRYIAGESGLIDGTPPPIQPPAGAILVNWHEAMAVAKRERKPVLVHFTADWCVWCKRMEAETYPVEGVKKRMEEQWIVLEIDVENVQKTAALFIAGKNTRVYETGDMHGFEKKTLPYTEMRTNFGISGIPTLLFIDKEGQTVSQVVGFQTAEQMQPMLDYFRDELYKKNMKLDEYIKDPY